MRTGRGFFVLLCILMLTGCSGIGDTPPSPTDNPDRAAASMIPWNKPASWEGSGALGGFMPQGGH
jgi:hypothetical protein